MRKFVLIAAMVLASATAQAGQSRSLTVATAEQPAASTQPAAAEPAKVQTAQTPEAATPAAAPAETPKYVERPAAIDTTTAPPVQPKADSKATPQTAKTDKPADKPKHKKYWTEARIIGELHRHGIYW
jgi:hypothetical protein